MPADKKDELAAKQLARIASLCVDALIIGMTCRTKKTETPESGRSPIWKRNPAKYMDDYFSSLEIPKIVYRCVGKYTGSRNGRLGSSHEGSGAKACSVFVGAASSKGSADTLKLSDAYRIAAGQKLRLYLRRHYYSRTACQKG